MNTGNQLGDQLGDQLEADFTALVSDLPGVDDAGLTARFRELELLQRQITAEMAVIAGEVERRGVYLVDGHRGLAGWLRAQGNYAPGSVSRWRRLARVVGDHPVVGEDLHTGRIGVDQAAELARVRANPRCGERLGDVVEVLVEHANGFAFDDFRACTRRWETLADLDGAHRDRGDAVRARRAAVVAGVNGVDVAASGGTALQAAEMAAIFDAFVDAEFRRDRTESQQCGEGSVRSHGQRCFDALVAIFRVANTSPGDGTPVAATVNVVCDQHTFEAALARHDLADEPRDLPTPDPTRMRCDTASGTVLLPDDAVFAALGGWVRRVVVDSAGVITDFGHRRRCFTGAAAEAARLLATHCGFTGCVVPEAWSQIDHIVEWVDGGATDQDNGDIECGHHNRHKHRCRLRTRRDHLGKLHIQRPDGTWIIPVGVDPPSDTDFLTDTDIDELIRQRLHNLHNEDHDEDHDSQ